MLLGIAHQLGGAVKPERLAVQQGCQKASRLMLLQPATDINQQRKAGGMAFREAVLAKALNLLKQLIRKFLGVAVAQHARDQPVIEMMNAAFALPRRHGAAQLVGLAG